MNDLKQRILDYCQDLYPESSKCQEIARELGTTKTKAISAAEELHKDGLVKLYHLPTDTSVKAVEGKERPTAPTPAAEPEKAKPAAAPKRTVIEGITITEITTDELPKITRMNPITPVIKPEETPQPESLDITLHSGGSITLSRGYHRVTLTKHERYRLKKIMMGE